MEYAVGLSSYNMPFIGGVRNAFRGFFVHMHDHVVPHARNHYRPHLLNNRSLALYGMLLLAVKVSVIALTLAMPAVPAFSSAITTDNVFNLTNSSRADNKLPALTLNSVLAKAAQAKADDMAAKGYFSHTSPDGRLPWDFITAAGYNYLTAGENLAEGFLQAESTEEAWMNSPGHRANILNKNYQEIGIGISEGTYEGNKTIFVVQMFGTSLDQPVKMLQKPTKPTVVMSEQVPSVASAHQDVVAAPTQPAIVAEPVVISNTRVLVSGTKVTIIAETSGPISKVIASFGETGLVLDPKEGGVWQGETTLSALSGANVNVQAYDMQGKAAQNMVASFSDSLQKSIQATATPQDNTINVFGLRINLKNFEQKFYILFVAGLLSALVIAIGLKRHIQHIGLIANTAFVAILALTFFVH